VLRLRLPFVPVTVTVSFPAAPLQDRVEFWEAPRTMLPGVRVHARPVGETDAARVTVPANPLTGAIIIVEIAVVPEIVLTFVGLATTLKSRIV